MTDTSQWVHSDRRGLDVAFANGLARAWNVDPKTGDVPTLTAPTASPTGEQSIADFRALVVGAAATFDTASITNPPQVVDAASLPGLGMLGTMLGPAARAIKIGPRSGPDFTSTDPSVFDGVVAIMQSYGALAARNAKQSGDTIEAWQGRAFSTIGAGAPLPLVGAPIEVAVFPILGAVAIVAGAAALAYLGGKAIDVYDRNIARESDTRRMLALTAKATDILGQHGAADAATGKSTPLTPAEQSVIDTLKSAITKYAIPEVNPYATDAKGSLLAGLGTVGTIAILAIVAYFAVRKG